MRNTIILSSLLFLAVIVASIYYFNNLDNSQQSTKSLRLLPQNTLMIAAITNENNATERFEEVEILEALIGGNNRKLWTTFRTQFLYNPLLRKFTSENKIYLSFHAQKDQVIPLFTIPTTDVVPSATFTDALKEIDKSFKTSIIDTVGREIYQIHFGEKDSILHTVYFQNNILASTSLALITQITDKHSKRLPAEQVDFFLKESPSQTPLSIYFPHQQYDAIINLSQHTKKGPFIDLFKKLHGQSVWNINFSQDAIILTGDSQLDQYPENYISIFKNQEKTTQTLFHYFPSNTAISAAFAISDFQVFQKDLQSLFKRRNESTVTTADTSSATSLLNKALGEQFALVETTDRNYLGFIAITDSLAFKDLSEEFFESTNDSIGRFAISNGLYRQYGDVFKSFRRPFFTVVDNILVVANSQAALRNYRKNYLNNNLLIGSLSYIQMEKRHSKEANVSIFVHTRNANSILTNALSKHFRTSFRDDKNFGYQNFFSWSIQLSGNKGGISSQIYAVHKSKSTLGIHPEWSFKMENKAITQPYVFQQNDTSDFILIQELDHTIHAISPKGDKIWSKVFAGRVVGEIQQLEDNSIILLTDKNIFYRIGTDGVPFKGFPKTLKTKPTGTALITSIEDQKTIVIPTENNLLVFGLDGKIMHSWESVITEGTITSNVLKNGKYFVFGTSTGQICWLDENGKNVAKSNTKGGEIVSLGQIANNEILALNNTGGVYSFLDKKEIAQWKLDSDSTNYFPSLPYTIGQNNNKMVIVNNNKLEIIRIKDTLQVEFQHIFTKPLVNQVQYFSNPEDKNIAQIGVASRATNLLYLFYEDGQIAKGFPVEGQPLFYYGKINNSALSYLLCMRRDNKLYAFKQQN